MGNNNNNNKFDRRNQGQNSKQQNNQKPAETPAQAEQADVATLEEVAADIEMMDAETANAYYLTYEDMAAAHAEMSRCKVPTVYITKMMADVLDLIEVNETEGGLIRTQDQVIAEIAKMDEIAALANEMLGTKIDLTTDDTPQAKYYRSLYDFKEDSPENQSTGSREVLIPKANEAALDSIFMEWAALSLTGYNAIVSDKDGNPSWLYNGAYDAVDAMYPQAD